MSRARPVFLTLLVVFGGVVGLAAAEEQVIGRPGLDVYSPNNELTPGSEPTLEVFIANDGQLRRGGPAAHVERVTTARATTIEVMSGETPIEVNTGRYAVGTVPEGTAGPIPIELTVPEGAEPGTYQLPVRVRYTYTRIVTFEGDDVEYSDNSYDQVQYLPVVITDDARFSVESVETQAQIGDDGAYRIEMRNVGHSTAQESSVTVSSGSDEVTFGTGSASATSFVGAWAPGEVKEIEVTALVAAEASARAYTTTVVVAYEDQDGIAKTSRELTASLRPLGEQAFSLENVESTLRVDQEGEVSGEIVNDGPGAVSEAVLVLRTENPNLEVTEREYAFESLAPGEREAFSFTIDVADVSIDGPRQLSFVVEYQNAAGDQRVSDTIDARVRIGERRDRFSVEPVEGQVAAGSSTEVTLAVTNDGDDTVRDVTAKLFPNDPLSSGDDEAFVSELAPGATAEFTFTISAAGSATAKTYPVSVDFQFETPDGRTELSRTYKVPIAVEDSGDVGWGLGLGIGVAVVVLGGGAAVWIRRRG